MKTGLGVVAICANLSAALLAVLLRDGSWLSWGVFVCALVAAIASSAAMALSRREMARLKAMSTAAYAMVMGGSGI
jgi:hypothetical protein